MSAIIGLLIVGVIVAVAFWQRCNIYPPICGGVGDNRSPFDTTGKNLTDFQRFLASAEPTVPVVKSPDRIIKVNTKGEGLTAAQKNLAGAGYARTFFGISDSNRLSYF